MLRREGRLDETQIVEFAKSGRFEELVAAMASLCAVPIEVVDRLMHGDRADPILILGKSAGWKWLTVKSDHHGAVRGGGGIEPGTRRSLRQFRATFGGDRHARDAVLADAAGGRCRPAL